MPDRPASATSATSVGRPAVFLDRDGVINENLAGAYVQTWERFHFLPGSVQAIARLTAAGWPVVVVTNQAGVGKGLMTQGALEDIHRRMMVEIEAAGGHVDAVLFCPHRADEHCDCRKPQPGLLRRAAQTLALDLARSVFVGDNVSDLQAGAAAGCRSILVLSGMGQTSRQAMATDAMLKDVPVVDDLPSAVALILGN